MARLPGYKEANRTAGKENHGFYGLIASGTGRVGTDEDRLG